MNEVYEHSDPSHDITIPGGPGKPPLHYTEEEWQRFRNIDKAAGKAVVLLMAGIFFFGLILYSAVAYVCWFKIM